VAARLFLLLCLIVFTALSTDGLAEPSKDKAFELKSLDGELVRLADFTNKIVILHFWTPTCFVCPEEVKLLNRLSKKLNLEKIEVLSVISFDTRQSSLDSARDLKLSFPTLVDLDGKVAELYGVKTLPATFFLGKSGKRIEINDPLDPSHKSSRFDGPRDWMSISSIESFKAAGFLQLF